MYILNTHPFVCPVTAACNSAATNDGNSVLLNEATDGVSCETENNKKSTLLYLQGKQNFMGIADTNHNDKNGRGQIVSGTSPSSIGGYVADPWMLKLAGVSKELYRIADWASDALVLKLCSPLTISKLIECEFADVGNLSTLVVSLTFIRLRSYSVNARDLNWRERCIYQYLSLLWFTSFHTPYRYVNHGVL